jgi:hypothetical protein
MKLELGDCVFIESRQTLEKHLFVIITEPSGEPPTALVVNFTTYRPHFDQTTILDVGEHSFIKRKSLVNYMRAGIANISNLESRIDCDRTLLHREKCSPELLQRIREGVLKSRFAAPRIQNYFKDRA